MCIVGRLHARKNVHLRDRQNGRTRHDDESEVSTEKFSNKRKREVLFFPLLCACKRGDRSCVQMRAPACPRDVAHARARNSIVFITRAGDQCSTLSQVHRCYDAEKNARIIR